MSLALIKRVRPENEHAITRESEGQQMGMQHDACARSCGVGQIGRGVWIRAFASPARIPSLHYPHPVNHVPHWPLTQNTKLNDVTPDAAGRARHSQQAQITQRARGWFSWGRARHAKFRQPEVKIGTITRAVGCSASHTPCGSQTRWSLCSKEWIQGFEFWAHDGLRTRASQTRELSGVEE